MLPLTVGIRDGAVQLVSTLSSAVISARAEPGSIITSALPVVTVLIRQRACICVPCRETTFMLPQRRAAYVACRHRREGGPRTVRRGHRVPLELRGGGVEEDVVQYTTGATHGPAAGEPQLQRRGRRVVQRVLGHHVLQHPLRHRAGLRLRLLLAAVKKLRIVT